MDFLKKLILFIIIIFCFTGNVVGQNMEKPVLIKAGNKKIDTKPAYTSPYFIDYDKDGLCDLIIGTYMGNFRFYKNIGTKENPRYNNYNLIQANGKEAIIPNW